MCMASLLSLNGVNRAINSGEPSNSSRLVSNGANSPSSAFFSSAFGGGGTSRGGGGTSWGGGGAFVAADSSSSSSSPEVAFAGAPGGGGGISLGGGGTGTSFGFSESLESLLELLLELEDMDVFESPQKLDGLVSRGRFYEEWKTYGQ